MHWADVIAKDIASKCDKPLIATGISPSGEIHVGSLREAITGESVRSALEALGKEVKLIYLVDDFDPLRKRYEFLPEEYEKYVNMPLSDIPCPCGKHKSYAHHYVEPFINAMKACDVRCEVIFVNEMYRKGMFAETIDMAFKRREKAMEILNKVTGREMKPDWAPFNPLCEKCGRFTDPILDTYEYPHVEYQCKCGHHGKADITKGEGKMPWRLEWPAKWMIFNTSAEPFGKDHAAAGGSYDSGKRIVSEIFGGKAPHPIPYEFVQLKSGGQIVQMHKSTGSSVTGLDAIGMTPPEVLNYLFLRVQPSRAIDYDSGMGLLDMADEYDRMERLFFADEYTEAESNSVEAYKIAQHNNVPKKLPVQVPMRHLVNLVQMAPDFKGVLEILSRTMDLSDATKVDLDRLEKRCECVRFWLNGFAPDMVKFSILPTIPADADLGMNEKVFFQALVRRMNDCPWDAETINEIVTQIAKDNPIGTKGAYKIMYKILIGKDRGPKLAGFLASMDKKFVINRFNQASN